MDKTINIENIKEAVRVFNKNANRGVSRLMINLEDGEVWNDWTEMGSWHTWKKECIIVLKKKTSARCLISFEKAYELAKETLQLFEKGMDAGEIEYYLFINYGKGI